MIKVIHNPRCSKSRCAIGYLKEQKIDFEIRDYQKEILHVDELKEICALLGVRPEAIVRKNEELFKEKFAGKKFTDEEWYQILADNPRLIQRPIVINGDKAVIARPAELIKSIFPF